MIVLFSGVDLLLFVFKVIKVCRAECLQEGYAVDAEGGRGFLILPVRLAYCGLLHLYTARLELAYSRKM